MKKWFEKHDLFKIVGIGVLLTVLLTWIIKPSSFSGTEMVAGEITRIGFNDFCTYGLLSIYYFSIIVTFLLILGGFYQILSKTSGYQKLITKLTSIFKGKEIVLVLISSFLFATVTAFSNEIYQVAIFAPLVITVLLNLKTDKITAFCATFGGILIGLMGAVYSPVILKYINQYLSLTYADGMFAKLVLFGATYILFNFFTIMHMKKNKSLKSIKETESFIFEVEENKDKEVKVWPLIVALSVLFVYQVIGYISWVDVFQVEFFTNWNTMITGTTLGTIFTKFLIALLAFGIVELINYLITTSKTKKSKFKLHFWPCFLISCGVLLLIDILSVGSASLNLYSINFIEKINTFFNNLTIGEYALGKTTIVNYLLGTTNAMGKWDLFTIQGIMLIISGVMAIVYKVKFNEYLKLFGEGAKKMLKPILIVLMIYIICIFTVMYPVIPTIVNFIMNLFTKFNVFTASVSAFLASMFNVEMRYTASSLFTYFTTIYTGTNTNLISLIFQAMNGLVQFIAPTSLILMLGLSTMNIKYSSWIKYIWLFFIGILIIVIGLICFVAFV